MSAFFVVSTVWAPGVMPNEELYSIIKVKVREMIDAGKLVKGTMPYSGKSDTKDGYSNTGHSMADAVEERPLATNVTLVYNEANKTFEGRRDPTEPAKFLRIFTSDAAANEWSQFALQYGATSSITLTAEEVAQFVNLPADEVIQQYVTQV